MSCTVESHQWQLSIEEGHIGLTTNTCGDDCRWLMAGLTHPALGYLGDEQEWLYMAPTPVEVRFATDCPAYPVDEAGVPTGPAERSVPYERGSHLINHGVRCDCNWWPVILPAGTELIAKAKYRDELRGERVDPRLLRWCEWPDCLRSFDTTTGPVGNPGWMRHRVVTDLLLCPEHHALNHYPSKAWTPGDDFIIGKCSCGETEQLRPANGEAVWEWWTEHVKHLNKEDKDGSK